MRGYAAELELAGKKYSESGNVFISVFESLYGRSEFRVVLTMPNISDVNSLVDTLAKGDEDPKISWGYYSADSNGGVWSAPRTLELQDLLIDESGFGYSVVLKATDKLEMMKNRRFSRTWKEKDVTDVLKDIASEYDLELDTDAGSGVVDNFLQCNMTDYDYISNFLIPKLQESQINSSASIFFFYVDKGEKLVIKTRQPKKGEKLEFSKDMSSGIPITNISMGVHLTPSQYITKGFGVDFVTEPFFFRSFESTDLEGFKYDASGEPPEVKIGVGKSESVVVVGSDIVSNIKVDDIVKGRMPKPELYKKFRCAVSSLLLPAAELAMEGIINYKQMYCDGSYIVYAIKTCVTSETAYTTTFLERASNKG